jgi:hypothetical protein
LHETLYELRRQYVSEGHENLDRIAGLLAELEAGPDSSALESLHRRFLGLAGSGYTYGFPEVSTLGRQGEKLCGAVLRTGKPSSSVLAACRSVLGRLREEFDRLRGVYSLTPWKSHGPPGRRMAGEPAEARA